MLACFVHSWEHSWLIDRGCRHYYAPRGKSVGIVDRTDFSIFAFFCQFRVFVFKYFPIFPFYAIFCSKEALRIAVENVLDTKNRLFGHQSINDRNNT